MTAIPTMLLAALWPGAAAALALGLVVGAVAGLPRDRADAAVALGLVAVFLGLSGLAVLGRGAGDVALRMESAAVLLALYLAGCAIGGFGRLAVRPSAQVTAPDAPQR